ncbi:MAG: YggS family pyridoxal phosphate-dependent enzyme [Clostridiales bacterium]|jgi:pyridoxal phosphate enzyme (YggS family)|nr:YggS family pyridoxal phosphate-dependent enzyme [Clostridiales bacterium]
MLEENVKKLYNSIGRVCAECGRESAAITVVAATKTVDPSVFSALPALGINIAGENRAQELCEKYERFRGIEYHFIGRLQTNKVRKVVGKVSLVQSLDSVRLADEIDRCAAALGIVADVLVEVNAGCEDEKGGVRPGELDGLIAYVKAKPALKLRGLMTVPPLNAPDSLYAGMRALFERCRAADPDMNILSMGMSGDYETAIRHGATMIRVGGVLFGSRKAAQ